MGNIRGIVGLIIIASCIQSLHACSYVQEMIYDKDMGYARVVRRRLPEKEQFSDGLLSLADMGKLIVPDVKTWTCPKCKWVNPSQYATCSNKRKRCIEQRKAATEPVSMAPVKQQRKNQKKGTKRFNTDCYARSSRTDADAVRPTSWKEPSPQYMSARDLGCICRERGRTLYPGYMCPAGQHCPDGNGVGWGY